ncbi:MAG: hypothetical protein JST54_22350 [Deltaproteobacteria bacterium]|nr:hypothetical protein [Deltaproteobacteria bacterium]
MTRLLPALLVFALAGCAVDDNNPNLTDAGPTGPRYDQLDQSNATMSLAVSADDSTATVSVTLTNSAGQPVTLQSGQKLQVNGVDLAGSAGSYAQTVPAASTYAVVVNEPRHGVLTTDFSPAPTFAITSTGLDLAGSTLTWSPVDGAAKVDVSMSQQGASTLQTADFPLTTDPGTLHLTDVQLSKFVQGFPLTLTITRTDNGPALQGVATSSVTLTRTRTQSITPTSSL